MRCRIDDEIAERASESEPVCANLYRRHGRLAHVEILLPELRPNRADQLVELNELGWHLDRFFAHQEDRAVGNPLQLVEIGKPALALLRVLDELGSEPHAGDRGAEIVTCCRHEAHAAFHGALEPGGQGVQGFGRRPHLGGTTLGQCRQDTVATDRFDRAFQKHKRTDHAVGHEDRDDNGTDRDDEKPSDQAPPRHSRRR
jgi:hypothetical protein